MTDTPTPNAAQQLPKLKDIGLIVVLSKPTGTADAAPADFKIAYLTDLAGFRQEKFAGIHSALCITPLHKDPNYDGLHLTVRAAQRLVLDLNAMAAEENTGVVELNNHENGDLHHWHSFTRPDAVKLGSQITAALKSLGQ